MAKGGLVISCATQCISSVLIFYCTAFHCFPYLTLQINVFYLFRHVSPLDVGNDECDSLCIRVYCIGRQLGSGVFR